MVRGRLAAFGPTSSTTAAQGMQQVLLSGKTRPAFFLKTWKGTDARRITLSAMRCRPDRHIETLWRLENLPQTSEMLMLDDNARRSDAAAMVRVRLAVNETATVTGHGVRPRLVENQPLGIDVSMPIVAKLRAEDEVRRRGRSGRASVRHRAAAPIRAAAAITVATSGPRHARRCGPLACWRRI